jgi:hypothetical protein
MALTKYDPALVVVTFAGIITGYAKGAMIKAGRAEDTWKLVVGADGLPCRVRNRNASGRCTLTLMQTSPSNLILSALATLDEQTGAGVVPFMLKDLGGAELMSAPEAWLTKPADKDYGEDLGTREWVIEFGELLVIV